jgi:hypothetical protein
MVNAQTIANVSRLKTRLIDSCKKVLTAFILRTDQTVIYTQAKYY